MRVEMRLPSSGTSTICLSFSQQLILPSATRTRTVYHLLCSSFSYCVVSFSEASLPLMLESPITVPAQPPTTKLACESRTGNVRQQKKSSPLRFIACKEMKRKGDDFFCCLTFPDRKSTRLNSS